jgi:hypothetical protein
MSRKVEAGPGTSLAEIECMQFRAYVLAGLVLAGCGKDSVSMGTGADGAVDDAGDVFDPPPGYSRLIGRRWEAPAGANVYKCVRVTVPADAYITSFVVQSPLGTHHGVLSIAKGYGTEGPDGEQDCTGSTIGMNMLYASAVGTEPLELPNGVGIHIPAGQQIHLNLHLFNAGEDDLSGESAIWIKASSTPPPTLAEMVLAGTIDINIPPDNTPHTVSGDCTARHDYSLFAVWPHMHALGTAQKVELVRGTSVTTLHDQPFRFDDQSYDVMHPVLDVATGDKVRVTCTYVNNTADAVTYGDGAGKEMCFSGLYRYPAVGTEEFCAD